MVETADEPPELEPEVDEPEPVAVADPVAEPEADAQFTLAQSWSAKFPMLARSEEEQDSLMQSLTTR